MSRQSPNIVMMKTVNVLLFDFEERDIASTLEGFQEINMHCVVDIIRDRDDASLFLTKNNGCSVSVQPDLLIVNYEFPLTGDKHFLEAMRVVPDFSNLPVILLLRSDMLLPTGDNLAALVNLVIWKPKNSPDFLAVANSVENFWNLHSVHKDE